MDSRSVSRCVAIAAHGKRCQQSPFRGSPYCWHHPQSRKVWAPSRPLGANARQAIALDETGGPPPVEVAVERRSGVERRAPWDSEQAPARRLVEVLGPERVEALLDFLETPGPGTIVVTKQRGGVTLDPQAMRPRRVAG
jgi:hypothetical protein